MLLDSSSLSKLKAEISCIGDPAFHGNTALYLEDIINNKVDHKVFAALRDGCIAGFLILSTVLDEAEIIEIAVSEDLRKKGIASELMREIFDWCQKNGIIRIFLEVRESNLPARECYKKFGFSEDGQRKNYYRDPVEDAVLMSGKISS
ncbi:ribosomal protein S18-alanine N-acetyltransferase [bacterium]|nr:ribosomal protein S18-alanine N-acetyltransferase [bacterium]